MGTHDEPEHDDPLRLPMEELLAQEKPEEETEDVDLWTDIIAEWPPTDDFGNPDEAA